MLLMTGANDETHSSQFSQPLDVVTIKRFNAQTQSNISAESKYVSVLTWILPTRFHSGGKLGGAAQRVISGSLSDTPIKSRRGLVVSRAWSNLLSAKELKKRKKRERERNENELRPSERTATHNYISSFHPERWRPGKHSHVRLDT